MTPTLCLLFDSDGTLVDSEGLLASVMGTVLPQYGLPFSAAEYMGDFRGVRFLDIVQTLEGRHGDLAPNARQSVEADVRSLMEARMLEELQPMPAMPEALDTLAAFPRAVVSNGPERKIRCALESTGLIHHFGGNLFSAYSLGCWKPDPAIYRKAAAAMGFAPEDCVVIDDAAVGVAAGLEAGMQVVHFNHLAEAGATPAGALAMSHASELPAVVASLAERCRPSPGGAS